MPILGIGRIVAIVAIALIVSASVVSAEQIFVSTSTGGTVDGVTFADEDIIVYDMQTDTWSRYFDGSDVGLASTDIDAIYLSDDGSILMSFTDPVTISGFGSVDDSDIVRFVPTSIGVNTSGSFEFFFDGSDVGLSENWEDIDAFGFIPDGRLVVSVTGDFSAGGVSRRDEDLVVFNDTRFGSVTQGSWAVYFDGSDVGLGSSADEDVKGTWIDSVSGDIYLNTLGNFSVSGVSGTGRDIFRFAPTSLGINTLGSYAQFWIGSQHDLLEMVDAISIGFPSGPEANDDTAGTSEDTPVNIDVLVNDTDPSGGTLSVVEVSQGANGTVTSDGTSVTYTPSSDFNGADSFTYTVSDGSGGTDTATVTVTVDPVNDPPTAVDDSGSTAADTAVAINVVANDSDIDGDGVAIESVSQGSSGTVSFDAAAGTVTYTPNADFFGQDSFTYTITDTVPWYADAQYQQRKRLRLDGSRIMGTLTDFPVLVSFTDAELTAALANGYDLVFTDEDGTTKLDYEREDWDQSTGAIVAWVRFPILTAGVDKVFYVYFDNDSEFVDQQNAAGVWNDDYKGVWHLNESPANGGTHYDSTANNNDGTFWDSDGDSNTNETGMIAGADDFSGDADYVDVGTGSSLDISSAITIEAWVRRDTNSDSDRIAAKHTAGDFGWMLGRNFSRFEFAISTNGSDWNVGLSAANAFAISTWYHVVATYDGSTMRLYLNGTEHTGGDFPKSMTGSINVSAQSTQIGIDDYLKNTAAFGGIIDEVRISGTARSAGWIATEYNNQNQPQLFLNSVGPATSVISDTATATVTVTVVPPPGAYDDTASTVEGVAVDIPAANLLANDSLADGGTPVIESVGPATNGTVSYNAVTDIVTFTPDPGFSGEASFTYAIAGPGSWYADTQYLQRKRLRLDGSRIMGTLTDFPVLVSFTDAELTAALANGYDLVFTDEDGTTKLDYEREDWDPSTGAIVAWVRFPILTAGVDKVFYIYFDKDGELVDQQNAAGVWNDNYKGVWHLNESPANGGIHYDSTANNNDGTLVDADGDSNTNATGMIAGANDFSGDGDYVDVGTGPSLDISSAITIEAWVKTDTDSIERIAAKHMGGDYGWYLSRYQGRFAFGISTKGSDWYAGSSAAGSFALSTWYHVIATYDGSTMRLYLNGTEHTGGHFPISLNGSINVSAGSTQIGRDGFSGEPFGGIIDEVRISATARTAAWIETSYNNQNQPQLFLSSVGPATSQNSDTATVTVTVLPPPGAYDDTASTVEEVAVDIPAANLLANDSLANGGTPAIDSVGPATNGTVSYNAVADLVTFTPEPNFSGQASFTYMITEADAVAWYADLQYQQRKRLRLDGSRIMGTLTDFPVLVSFTDAELTAAQANGYDLVFTDEDGTTRLDYEREDWDPSTGAIVAWVRFPVLTAGVDKVFYIYFDKDSEFVDQQNAAGVWNDNYKGVWHLNESPANGGTHYDSTANNNDGTFWDSDGDSNTNATGMIAGADNFNGDADYVDVGTGSSLDISSAITIEAWVRRDTNSDSDRIAAKHTVGDYGWMLGRNFSRFEFDISTNGSNWNVGLSAANAFAISTWYHVVATYDGSTMRLYLNGTEHTGGDFPKSLTGSINVSSQSTEIGIDDYLGETAAFGGIIDEVRISGTARTAAWIETSYNNQNQPLLFLNSVEPATSFVSDTATVTVTVTNVNDPPSISSSAPVVATEDVLYSYPVAVDDPDDANNGTDLTFGLTAAPSGMTISSTGVIEWTPLEGITTSGSVTVEVADGGEDGAVTASETFTVAVTAVNDAPVISAQGFGVSEDATNGASVGTVSAGDADGDALSYAITAGNGSGVFVIDSVTGALTVADNSSLDFETTPSYALTVEVSDPGALSAEATMTVTVGDANDAPTIAAQGFGVSEDAANGASVGTVSAGDADGDALSYAITAGNGSGVFAIDSVTGALTVADNSSLDFETTPSYALTVEVSDPGALIASATMTVNVSDTNEAPTGVSLANTTTALLENTDTSSAIKMGDIVVTDDALGTETLSLSGADASSFQIVGTQLQLRAGTVLDVESQSSYVVTVAVDDLTVGATPDVTVDHTLTLTDVNEAPTDISLDNATVAENSLAGTLVGNLSATDPDAGDSFTYALVSGTGYADNASFQVALGSQLQTNAVLDFEAQSSYSVRVRVTDSGTPGLSYEEAFSLSATDVNEAPAIIDQGFGVAEDAANAAVLGTVSASDPDAGDTLVQVQITTLESAGALLLSGVDVSLNQVILAGQIANLSFVPAADGNGSPYASFGFKVHDGTAYSAASYTMSVDVTAVNDPPTANNDFDTTFTDTAVTINVVANDSIEPDTGETLTITAVTQGGSGSVTFNAGAGTVTYTPNAGYAGIDGFTYTVSDGNGGTATGDVLIVVVAAASATLEVAVNEAPVAGDDHLSTDEDTALTFTGASLLANDTDVDEDTLAITNITSPAKGTLIDNGDGSYTYTPNAGFRGTDSFTYSVSDGKGGTNTGTVDVKVGPFTIAVLPDTQSYTSTVSFHEIFFSQTQWLADQRDSLDLQYVLHVGDVTDNNTIDQWDIARQAFETLDVAGLPYAIAPGNQDYGLNGESDNRDSEFNDPVYFGPDSPYSTQPSIGGFFEEGRTDNSYHIFRAGGRDWIVLALEWGPRDAVVDWADQVLSNHPGHTGILVTHAYMYSDDTLYNWELRGPAQNWSPHDPDLYGTATSPEGTNDGEELWYKLVSQHNIVFVFNGHVLNDGTGRLTSVGDFGQVTHQMLANYEAGVDESVNGGNGFMRLIEIHADGTVQVRTYSPYLDEFKTDLDQEFTLDLVD